MTRHVLLLADNQEEFRETWGKVLSDAGDVRLASEPQQAQSTLRETKIDLAILDLRLVDDNDEQNISGLETAIDRAYRRTPKIILTAFPTSYENLRRVLDTAVDELPAVMAFVDKAEGPEALLEVIRRALETWPRLRMAMNKVSEQIKAEIQYRTNDWRSHRLLAHTPANCKNGPGCGATRFARAGRMNSWRRLSCLWTTCRTFLRSSQGFWSKRAIRC